MPTTITFTFQDLLLFVLWGLLVTVFVLLIMILIKAWKIMKHLQFVVSDNKVHIDKTLEIVPKLSDNFEKISSEIAHDVAAFRPTVDHVAATSENVTAKLNENSGLVSGIGSIVHTISIGKALYDKYFGKKTEATLTDLKEAIYDVGDTIRSIEKENAEREGAEKNTGGKRNGEANDDREARHSSMTDQDD